MRIRLRWWREIFFLAALLFSLAALLPLRVALDWLGFGERGLSAREAKGSVWAGALADARFGTIPLGDVATRLRALPLLTGRARLDVEQEGDGFRGGLTVSRHGFGVDDASGTIAVAGLESLPVATLDLNDLSARFEDSLCASADGRVTAHVVGELAGVPLGATLAGDARCDGQTLLLPLVSPSGAENLSVRLYGEGRYRVEAVLRTPGAPPYSGRFDGSF